MLLVHSLVYAANECDKRVCRVHRLVHRPIFNDCPLMDRLFLFSSFFVCLSYVFACDLQNSMARLSFCFVCRMSSMEFLGYSKERTTMEDSRFDELTKALSTPTSRRQALKTFTATTLAGILSLSSLDKVFAKHCTANGHKCRSSKDCCSGLCDPTTSTCVCPPSPACNSECPCPSDSTCINGTCCPNQLACGSVCCSGGTCCSFGVCCGLGTICTSNGTCCPTSQLCPNGSCCPTGTTCLSNNTCARPCSSTGDCLSSCGGAGACVPDTDGVHSYCTSIGNSHPSCISDINCPQGDFCSTIGGNVCLPAC